MQALACTINQYSKISHMAWMITTPNIELWDAITYALTASKKNKKGAYCVWPCPMCNKLSPFITIGNLASFDFMPRSPFAGMVSFQSQYG